jgi:hypothetical protein
MEAVILSNEQFEEILKQIETIKSRLKESEKKNLKEKIINNQEFLLLMNISKRTAQSWRDEGVIPFSQIGSKIYYRWGDIETLLENNYNRAFKTKK